MLSRFSTSNSPAIRIERIEGYRVVLLVRNVDPVLPTGAVVNHAAQSLIAVARIYQQDMCALLVILPDQMVGEEGLPAA